MPSRPTRRQVLIGTLGTLGVAGVAGAGGLLAAQEWPAPPPQRVPAPARRPEPTDAVATTEWVFSPARGRRVRLVTVLPPTADRATLPVVLGLHGLRGNALFWADLGFRGVLGDAWSPTVAGPGNDPRTPQFALVALDGGDNYWHPYRPTDDPMRMLLDEVPGWLAERGFGAGEAAAVTGVSMGGAGALMYARARRDRGSPVAGVAAMSPGLFTDWRLASRRPFAGAADWVANDPLRFYPELAGTPTGIWCGDRDPFVDATRRYIALARPEIGRISPGRHDGVFYASVLPDVVGFLGRHVTATGTAPRPVG